MTKQIIISSLVVAVLVGFAPQTFAQANDPVGSNTYQAPNFGTQSDPYADAFAYEFQQRHAHATISPEIEQSAQAQCKETYWGWVSSLDEVCLAGVQIGKRAYEELGDAMPKVLAECAKFSSNGSSQNACFAGAYFVIGKGPRMWMESEKSR